MKTVRIAGKNYSIVVERAVAERINGTTPELISITRVAIFSDGAKHEASGFSIKSPSDVYNRQLGLTLALGRALRNMKVKKGVTVSSRPLSNDEKREFYRLCGVGS